MMPLLPTKCAPAERKDYVALQSERETVAERMRDGYFDFFPLPLLVLNPERQIVFCNSAFLDAMGATTLDSFIGKRLGEALSCAYARVGPGGCGTSEHCRECGALFAILESIAKNTRTQRDCQLLQKINGETVAKDLRVFASPWKTDETSFFVVTIMDIADEKRRLALERIFFHDILNAAGGARGLADLLYDDVQPHLKQNVGVIRMALFGMVEEIEKQKQLLALENGEYVYAPIMLQGMELVQAVAAEYRGHPAAYEKSILIAPESCNACVRTDFSLLRRVLGNMIKNALEATELGGAIQIGLRTEDEKTIFWVHNEQAMSEKVKLQVFKRSFSTKGQGRGLGTYSIKLLTENYLSGEVGFSSSESEGTTYWVKLPSCAAADLT